MVDLMCWNVENLRMLRYAILMYRIKLIDKRVVVSVLSSVLPDTICVPT